DLVDAVAFSDRPTLASTRQIEIPGEDVARITIFVPAVAFVAATTTAGTAIRRFATVAVVASRIVSVPHGHSVGQHPSAFASTATAAGCRRLCPAESP